ncbi:MAG: hypothetical protein DRO87_04525 [Candidatus Thorarchaeota archaeon]|nr:MAG: hypothetical protein DRP09_00085 [Candidatus Thorarchaeota archaeon]RLI58868.1 MAG: hypothetical protein DRO87_04525 [Candidatus Thorarchaeota archaeon]
MVEMFDVAVIGGGPGGATAARYAVQRGLSTCIIDKDHFPRDKPCGGGFSEGILDEFPYLRPRRDDFVKGVARVGVLHSPNRRIVLRGGVDMAVALRYDFDNVLFESAVEEGAEPILGERAKSLTVSDSKVAISLAGGRTVSARVVVGADGVTSMVARRTALNQRWPTGQITACRVAEIPVHQSDIEERYTSNLEYHFFANLGGKPGYGWIFPKCDTINVGLGIVGKYAAGLPTIFDSFVRFLKKKDFLPQGASLEGATGALVPTGGPIRRIVDDRVMLVGDSAGMVNPLTGGGISYAMTAGRLAAAVVGKAIERDDVTKIGLHAYQELWNMGLGNTLRKQTLAQKIFTSPFTDLLFEIGSRDPKIQVMVSQSMAESGHSGIDVRGLLTRTLLVCLRGALGKGSTGVVRKSIGNNK